VLSLEHLFKPSGCEPLAWLNLWAQGAYEQPAGSTSYAFLLCSFFVLQQNEKQERQHKNGFNAFLFFFCFVNVCAVCCVCVVKHTFLQRYTKVLSQKEWCYSFISVHCTSTNYNHDFNMYKHFRPNKYVYTYICLHNIITQQRNKTRKLKTLKKVLILFYLCALERERGSLFFVCIIVYHIIYTLNSRKSCDRCTWL
jgi:hypothetical protein